MILYKYTADCSKLNLDQEGTTKEGYEGLYPRRSDIAEWNSKFYTAYRTEKKFFIMVIMYSELIGNYKKYRIKSLYDNKFDNQLPK